MDLSPYDLALAVHCIDADRRAGRLNLWWWSTVIDENVGRPVISTQLYQRLHEAGGVDVVFPIGNAGIIHVYGYQFSTVQTPYGLKSDRWTDGRLARMLDRPPSHFQLGDDMHETPLQRVSDAAMPLLLVPPRGSAVIEKSADGVRTRAVVTPPGADGAGVLISAVDDGDGWSLVTLFPVDDAARFAREAEEAPAKLRWNAALPPRPRP
ncbi:hypothetical protein [Microbacterium indicum]|uniref:hypothetical protein n=1 Tax=Microbacterium indicum TaxID=358100 RepID=UPI0004257099|nr:hypothetical protein [Microbacterium indicum]